jgi:hypothetical protein|tara:strand:- start:86 stop:442 length:357 start_codon:yes stop_codon:yes gene_type:complete
MNWISLVGKGLFSGAVIVTASEIAKRSATFGALVISLPLASIIALTSLYNETSDVEKVAEFAEGILWLVLPSLVLFITLPIMLRKNIGFEVAMASSIIFTLIAYGIGIWAAQTIGNVS